MSVIQQPTMLFGFLLCLVTTILIYYFGVRRNPRLPPGTFGWCPILGQTLAFLIPHASTSMGDFLENNIRRYGKIFRSHLFGYPTIVSCDAEFNMFVLRNEGHLFATGYPRNIPEVLGDLTLLHLTGEAHKRLRGVALSFFATVKTESEHFLADIEAGALEIINPWKDKETLHFCDEARKFTFNVIVKQILSLRPDDHEATEILQKFHSFMEGLISVPINLPGTPYAKAIKARLEIEDIARVLLHARRKVQTVDANRRTDFLDVLLSYEELSEEEIVSMVMGLLLGGYETTASLLAIIVKFLGDDLKALNELQEEHQKVLEKKKDEGGGLRWEDYQCMTFTQNVINEALRLGNVVKFVHRRTIQPIQYKGYEIPKGWKVLPVFTGVHMDSSLYLDPHKFNPWRWQNGDDGAGKSFMPFGGGKKHCPGWELAKIETAFFIHHLVLKYSWTPLMDTDVPISFPYLDFKHGLQISLKPLSPES